MANERQQLLNEVMNDRAMRVAFCEKSFKHFVLYYMAESIKFPKLAPYHNDRITDFEQVWHMYIEAHRDAAKTTILGVANRIRKICYRKKRFMVNLCHEKKKAEAFNKIILNVLLTNERIKADFGILFNKSALQAADELLSERGIKEFVTTNAIKVKAFGMGEAVRGELYYTPDRGILRPDDLFVDDIDNHDNTKNKRIIEDDMEFIKGEVFGGLTADAQVVRLGNIIRSDGRNPRMRSLANTNKKRKVYRNFIYGEPGKETGVPAWERYVNTDTEANIINSSITDTDAQVISLEQKKRDEGSGFTQNWLGIPMAEGEKLFKAERIQKIQKSQLPSLFNYVQIGGDPAFSLKQTSDAFGVVILGVKYVGNEIYFYVLTCRNLKGEEKREENYKVVFKTLYQVYGASRIQLEKNNGGEVAGRILQGESLAVDMFSTYKDKVTRAKEKEGHFMGRRVFFVEGETEEVIEQLLSFTGEDGNEDDLVDALFNAMEAPQNSDVFI